MFPAQDSSEHGLGSLFEPLLHSGVLRDVVSDQLQSLAVSHTGLHAGLVVEVVSQQVPVSGQSRQ